MADRKKTRELIGYTHQEQRGAASLWYKNSLSFHDASNILHEFQERVDGGIRIFQYNAALSLELVFKAILAAKGEAIPTIHTLRELCTLAEVELDEDQKHTLDLLTESILWLSRYPTPKSEGQWDKYHDNILEKHIIRTQNSTLSNPKRFPSMGNYSKIWEICLVKYAGILPK